MPRLEDIDKLGKTLLPLGNEPSVLARWGEDPEMPATPRGDSDVDPELAALLQGFGDEPDEPDEPEEAELGDEFPDDPFAFDPFADKPTAGGEADSTEPDEVPEEAADAGETFDLDGFDNADFDFETEADELPAEAPEQGDTDWELPSMDTDLDEPDPGDVEPADFEPTDTEPGGMEVGDMEADDLEPGDLEADDLEIGDMEPGDLEADDMEIDDLETSDLEPGGAVDDLPEPVIDNLDDFSFSDDDSSGSEDAFTFDPGEFEIDDEVDEISLGEEPSGTGRRGATDDFAVDSFDTAGFGGEDLEGGEQFTAPGEDLDGFDDDSGELLEVDEFSLGDFGAQFGVLEDETALEPDEDSLNPAGAISDAPPEAIDAAGLDVELSDDDFAELQRTLSALPLNVKVAVEEIIAESSASAGDIAKLIRLLVRGESVKNIAQSAGRISGKELRVPKGYEKRTGLSYEEERASLGYRFREYVWPVLRVVAGVAIIVALAGFLTYSYVWRPLHARGIYRDGLEHLSEGRHQVAVERFAQAETIWRARRWFYAYADEFILERRYQLAVDKYEALLRHWPEDERGILDYARLESRTLGNHAKAEALLERILDRDSTHYAALLAGGDNYLEWALEDPARFENARASYARLIGRYGDRDELLFRMLRYFIRADGLHGDYHRDIIHLKNVFEGDQKIDVDPAIYAELGGYLLDRDDIRDVFDILTRANRRAGDIDLPVAEIHYQFARFYRRMHDSVEEARALRNSRLFFEHAEPLDRRQLAMLIDTYGRIGEFHYERQEFIDAEDQFGVAIGRYENALARNLVEPQPMFGRLYAALGDIHFYVGRNWEQALAQYRKAEQNLFGDREMSYRKGFVHYRAGRYDEALDQFFDAAEGHTTNPAILIAKANSLFYTGTLYPAQGIYTELLDEMGRRRSRISTLLLDEDPVHRSVIEYLIRSQNNLGVTYSLLARRQSDPESLRRAMIHLQASQELAVNFRRSPQTGARAEVVNLAQLNLRNILYPLDQFEPQIYNAIPMDFSDLEF